MENRMKILDKLNVKELFVGCEMKSHILAFFDKDIWNFCQINPVNTDLDFITFVWVFRILCAVPSESKNYNVYVIYIYIIISIFSLYC